MNKENNVKPLLVIKASAGSGKTYQLTYEYIKLLLGEKNSETGTFRLKRRTEYHQHILAVTFTNKATDEMKAKIVKELDLLSRGESGYAKSLTKDLNTTEEELKKSARIALEEMLFNYTTFNVSTIDSFFQTVLRTFAYELDQDYDYAVELDDDFTVSVAVHNLLSEIGTDVSGNNLVQQWLGDYMRHLLDDDKQWDVFRGTALSKMARNLGKEFYQNNKKKIDEYLSDVFNHASNPKIQRFKHSLKSVLEKEKKRIDDLSDRYTEILESVGLSVDQLSSQSGLAALKNGLVKRIPPKEEGLVKIVDTFVADSSEKIVAKWSTDKQWKKKVKAGEYDTVAAVVAMRDLAEETLLMFTNQQLLQGMISNLYLLGLLGVIDNELEKFLRENDTILLSGTNQLLEDVMVSGNVMFMYERLGTWINHFLIDEFQDTSAMQYRNMKPLLEESVACDNENLVIGDEKQCIYRFRNSDPMLLQEKIVDDFSGSVFVDNTKVVNWRSTPNVIQFNNTLFHGLVTTLGVEETYANLIQTVNGKDHGNDGAVQVTIIDESQCLDDAGKSRKFNDIVLDELPALINEIRSRGYKMKDIAILVNVNNEGSDVIDAILRHNLSTEDEAEKIEVISGESMYLRKSPAVRLVISNLRYFDSINLVESGNDAVAAVREREEKIKRVLRRFDNFASNYRGNAIDESSDEYGKEMGRLLRKCFREDADMQKGKSSVNSTLQYSKEYLSLRDELVSGNADAFDMISIVENIICKVVAADIRESEKAFLMAFMDCVIDYCSKYTATIHSFLKWWDNSDKLTISSPGGRDAVNVMTIHKSKGLEFPCVIVPFAKWDMVKMDNEIWIKGDEIAKIPLLKEVDMQIIPPMLPIKTTLAEKVPEWNHIIEKEQNESTIDNMNKTYVALTRAVNEMHIFAPAPTDKPKGTINEVINDVCEGLNDENAKELNDWFAEKKGFVGENVAVAVTSCESEDGQRVVYTVGDIHQIYSVEKQDVNVVPEIGETPAFNLPTEVPEYDASLRKISVNVPETYNPLQDKGIKMHNMLSMLKRKRCRDRVLSVARRKGLIKDFYEDAVALVDYALSDPKTASWFADDNQVFNERTIFRGGGKKHKRPDRIIRKADGTVVVIDYKFGEDRKKDSLYKKQVKEYIDDLADAGLKVDEGYVWYPETGVILQVK